jgi:hypothetical protein
MALAGHLILVTVAEGEAGWPALEVEEARYLLLEVEELVGKSKEEVVEPLNLGRLASSAAAVVEQHLQGEQHVHKMKTYLEKEYCALEVAVGLARVRVFEAPESFAL